MLSDVVAWLKREKAYGGTGTPKPECSRGEYLRYYILGNRHLLVELCENSFSECIHDSFKVYF